MIGGSAKHEFFSFKRFIYLKERVLYREKDTHTHKPLPMHPHTALPTCTTHLLSICWLIPKRAIMASKELKIRSFFQDSHVVAGARAYCSLCKNVCNNLIHRGQTGNTYMFFIELIKLKTHTHRILLSLKKK